MTYVMKLILVGPEHILGPKRWTYIQPFNTNILPLTILIANSSSYILLNLLLYESYYKRKLDLTFRVIFTVLKKLQCSETYVKVQQ